MRIEEEINEMLSLHYETNCSLRKMILDFVKKKCAEARIEEVDKFFKVTKYPERICEYYENRIAELRKESPNE